VLSVQKTIGLYIHWPFCHRICPYCDFNVYKDSADHPLKKALFAALLQDIEHQFDLVTHGQKDRGAGYDQIGSIYFGGGTPSLLTPSEIETIIHHIGERFCVDQNVEITLEVNPTDAESAKITGFLKAGINRLSLGVQSFQDEELAFLGRNHKADEARRALDLAVSVCERVSVDLIGGLAGQSLKVWEANLKMAAEAKIEHISPYGLTIEPDTAFGRAAKRGKILSYDDEAWEAFFDMTDAVLSGYGFDRYEVSNHARSFKGQSRHNVHIWQGGDYMGIGPGAHGRLSLRGVRYETLRPLNIKAYIDEIKSGHLALNPQSAQESFEEILLFGIRQKAGIRWSQLSPSQANSLKTKLANGDFDGFIEFDEEGFRASHKGVKLLDHLSFKLLSQP